MFRLSKLEELKRITDESLRAEPLAAGSYGVWGQNPKPLGDFRKKKTFLMPLDHISHMFRAISKN